jgi:hypothetical protein
VNVNAQPFSVRRDIMQEVAERIGAAIGREFHAAVDTPPRINTVRRARA